MKKLYFLLVLVMVVTLSLLFSACCKKQVKKQPVVPEKKVEQPKQVEKTAPVVKEQPKPQTKEEVTSQPVSKPSLPTYHEVKKGECLWKISEYKEIYNDPFMWPLIYRANKDKIHDPDLIFPKQVFRIPRDYTVSQKMDAIHFAKTRGPWSLWDGK